MPVPSPKSFESMTTKAVDLLHLRNVVLAGHAGSGKTTLAAHLAVAWAKGGLKVGVVEDNERRVSAELH